MLNSILLAFSVSIDSLGIGISYGIKNTKFYISSIFILSIMSILFVFCSFIIGDLINSILSNILTKIISSVILVIIGIIILLNPIPFDFNKSHGIDIKEALILGTALSLDSVCVGIGGSIGGYSNLYFPFFVAIFQLLFIFIGYIIGKKLVKFSKLPDKIWNIISGVLIMLFGIIKYFI